MSGKRGKNSGHPEIGPPPCDEPCARREWCKHERVACGDFARYVHEDNAAARARVEPGREPTRRLYLRVFPTTVV